MNSKEAVAELSEMTGVDRFIADSIIAHSKALRENKNNGKPWELLEFKNLPLFAKYLLQVQDANNNSAFIPLEFTSLQMYVFKSCLEDWERFGCIDTLVPKGRRAGMSVLAHAMAIQQALRNGNGRALNGNEIRGSYTVRTVADSDNNAIEQLKIARSLITPQLKSLFTLSNTKQIDFLKKDNAHELQFYNDSLMTVTTGAGGSTKDGGGAIAAGGTTNFWHPTESFGFTFDNVASTILTLKGKNIIKLHESTTRGNRGYVYHDYERLKNKAEYEPGKICFLSWIDDPNNIYPINLPEGWQPREVTLKYLTDREIDIHKIPVTRLAWCDAKLAELGGDKFRQEYPTNINEAFSSTVDNAYIQPMTLERAFAKDKAKMQEYIKKCPISIGLDLAISNDDAVIAVFQGFLKQDSFSAFPNSPIKKIPCGVFHEYEIIKLDKLNTSKSYENISIAVAELVKKYENMGHNVIQIVYDGTAAQDQFGGSEKYGYLERALKENRPYDAPKIQTYSQKFTRESRLIMFSNLKAGLESGEIGIFCTEEQKARLITEAAAVTIDPYGSDGEKIRSKNEIKRDIKISIDVLDSTVLALARLPTNQVIQEMHRRRGVNNESAKQAMRQNSLSQYII